MNHPCDACAQHAGRKIQADYRKQITYDDFLSAEVIRCDGKQVGHGGKYPDHHRLRKTDRYLKGMVQHLGGYGGNDELTDNRSADHHKLKFLRTDD